MKNEGRFWDRMAARYYRSPIKDPEAYEQKLEITRNFLTKETRVLEFGCGTGGTAIAHAPHVEHIHAIDVSENMLEFARARAKDTHIDNVTFERSSIESLTASDASYDVILGLSILHLLENREEVLEKVLRLLKPGGVFISSTACMGDNLPLFKYIIPVGRALRLFPIVKVFKQEQLLHELQTLGYSIEHEWRPQKSMAAFIVAIKDPAGHGTSLSAPTEDQAARSSENRDLINATSY